MNDKPRTAEGYSLDDLNRVRSTCLQVATILGDLLEHITIVGGLVPFLLVGEQQDNSAYVGTMDLDLALGKTLLDKERYREISQRLDGAGFHPDSSSSGNPTPQRWIVMSDHGDVCVEFLIAPPNDERAGGQIFHLEDRLAAIVTPGLELAFSDREKIKLQGKTLQGDLIERHIWVCGPGAFVVLKALAYSNRGEPKDAYDIFYLLQNYEHGLSAIAGRIRPHLGNKQVRIALKNLERDFGSVDHKGSRDVARFITGALDENLQYDAEALIRQLIVETGISS